MQEVTAGSECLKRAIEFAYDGRNNHKTCGELRDQLVGEFGLSAVHEMLESMRETVEYDWDKVI